MELGALSLYRNHLSGSIPTELGDLVGLDSLLLFDNGLIGEIPVTLGLLTNLRGLSLSSNELTGEIPKSLGSLSELQFLQLQGNQISGEIPAELGHLVKLRLLNLGNNRLSGRIPPDLGRLADLWALSLGSNQLTGAIPATLGRLKGLISFGVSSNLLTGCVPLPLSRFDRVTFSNTDLSFCFAVDDSPTVPVSSSLLTMAEEGEITIDESVLLANDMETKNSTLRITEVSDAVNGTVSVEGPTITYVHDGSETTTGGFTYTASDTVHASTAIVTITVTPVNDPPVAVGDTAVVNEGDTLSLEALALLDNDTDAENDTLSVSDVGYPTNGTVSLVETKITYEHDGSETEIALFSYTVSDGTDTATATVTISVTPINDPPVTVGDTAEVDEGDTLSLEATALLDNDTDAENDPLSVVEIGDAVNGTVLLEGTTIVYEHDDSETTTGSFSYTVTDGTDTDAATVTISVMPIDDAQVGAGEETPVPTATPGAEATASPTTGPAAVTDSPPTTSPEASVQPTDDGGINLWPILLFVAVAVAIVSVGAVVVLRERNRA